MENTVKFPTHKYPDDVTGSGTAAQLSELLQKNRRLHQFTEIRIIESGEHAAGTFGQFQCFSGSEIEMSVRFQSNGQGSGITMEDVVQRTTLAPDSNIEWVIHQPHS